MFQRRTVFGLLAGAASAADARGQTTAAGLGPDPRLPAPDTSHEAQNYSEVVGWPEGRAPTAPPGFRVRRVAGGLDSPRWLLVLPNRDLLVSEATTVADDPNSPDTAGQMRSGSAALRSANRITLLRDADGDGIAETRTVLLQGLNQPFGLALVGEHLYIADTDALMRYPFAPGQTRIEARGEKLLDLPAGGYNNHWTRNILPSRDGRRLYVSVGSSSNVGEHGLDEEVRRACILSVGLDGGGETVVASGLRNPVGMAFEPVTGALWTAVNERDMLGDDLVPDYITSVRDGGFYGWPFSYWGAHPDPRLAGQRPDLVQRALAPDYALGAHTASLGLAFYEGGAFPEAYRGGAFVAQRGSWNRRPFSGYKVIFVPFKDGRPSGPPQDFLTGFMPDPASGKAFGRPVGVFADGAGGLLVTDDAGDSVWRVSAAA